MQAHTYNIICKNNKIKKIMQIEINSGVKETEVKELRRMFLLGVVKGVIGS